MKLHSGLPYWIIKNRLYDYYNPLKDDVTADVAVIGSGITGALAAHELCKAGFDCCVLDKRSIATGSSAASTALLQYEIDLPLHKLAEKIGEDKAVTAYRSCLDSITELGKILEETSVQADFVRRPSIFYASDSKGEEIIAKEYEIRTRHGLPAELVSREVLQEKYGLHTYSGALCNCEAAEVDAYKAATGLLDYDMRHNGLRVYTHTEISDCIQDECGCILTDMDGHTVKCRYVVVAAGFEAGQFLPEKVMKLTSTYALVSHPVDERLLWPGRALIWETAEPYVYMRTTKENRIIMGGEDDGFYDPKRRDRRLARKVRTLEKKFCDLFPDIPFTAEMAWCGTFSSTDDGLPFIGPWKEGDRVFYDLGYGGNGITFSVIGAKMISRTLSGHQDSRYGIFGFGRLWDD